MLYSRYSLIIHLKYQSITFQSLSHILLLGPHGLEHARLHCPWPTPGVYPNTCPLSHHPTISSSFIPFSSHPESFPASGSFPMSWFFTSGSQRIGASASASVLPMNIQDWFPSGWTGWITRRLSRVFSNTTIWKHQFFVAQPSSWSNSHIMTTGKTIAWLYEPLSAKWCLCFLISCLGFS